MLDPLWTNLTVSSQIARHIRKSKDTPSPWQPVDKRKPERAPVLAVCRLEDRYVSFLPGQLISVGRKFLLTNPPNHHTFDKQNLSRVHAYIGVDGFGNVFVIDLGTNGGGSTNGTFKNGMRLVNNLVCFIEQDDQIWFGLPNNEESLQLELLSLELA